MDSKKPIIVAMASLKGGEGKSVLSILFSYILKDLGKKVLLIDLDTQNALTSYFEKYVYDVEKYNIYNMLKGDVYFDKCINKINDYISIIPSHPMLSTFSSDNIDNKEVVLKYFLSKNVENYDFDYILIDTPPSLDFVLKNALNVADHIIIPVQVKRWSIESLGILMKTVNDIKNTKNKIYNISIVENQFIKNRNTLKELENILYKKYGDYIKGKIHYYNSIIIFINKLLEPSSKEIYYNEASNTIKNIFYL